SSAPSRVGLSSAIIRFMRSAPIGSKSARWQTTSSVLHLPGTGRAWTCSRLIPATACRRDFGPAKYSSTNAESDGIGCGSWKKRKQFLFSRDAAAERDGQHLPLSGRGQTTH